MFSALKFIVASVIVALFGGFLIAGILTTPDDHQMAPAAVTASPSPMSTDELLSGMVTEEVEPGVFRVVDDGERDLSPAAHEHVVVGQDGSIWLGSYAGDLSKLGATTALDWQLTPDEYLMDFEVAPDGAIWAVVATGDESTDRDESSLRSFDGETWTTHRTVDMSRFLGDVEITSDGVVWAVLGDGSLGYADADGSAWQTIETPPYQHLSVENVGGYGFIATESGVSVRFPDGVWHYADGVWDHIPYSDPGSGKMPEGAFWGLGSGSGGSDEILHRHDETGWQGWSLKEQRMLASWGAEPIAVAPDGSFWAAWPGRGGLGTPDVLGVNRFDGRAWERFLPAMSVWPHGMDVAPDGSVWLIAWEESGVAAGQDRGADAHLYVITPEAVAGTES